MPGQGGLEVLKILRSNPLTAGLPVVVLTAMDDEANTRAGFEFGATDYVTKPFSIPQLAARIRACLKRSEPEGADGHGAPVCAPLSRSPSTDT